MEIKEKMTIADILKKAKSEYPDAIAVISDDAQITYAELEEKAQKLAQVFLQKNIQKGDRVGIFLRNKIETIICFYAIALVGAVEVALNVTTDSADSIAYKLHEAGVNLLFMESLSDALLFEKLIEVNSLKEIVFTDSKARVPASPHWTVSYFSDLFPEGTVQPVQTDVNPEDLYSIAYTSGTSGVPKGVMLSHGNLVSVSQSKARDISRFKNNCLLLIPLYHIYSVMIMNACFLNKGTIILMENFVLPAEILNILKKRDVRGIIGVPMILKMILNIIDEEDYPCIKSLQFLHVGGAKIPKEVFCAYWKINPNLVIMNGYGLTEASAKGCLNVLEGEPKNEELLESCGTVNPPFEIIIIDDQGNKAGPGIIGEVLLKGPNIMQGYLNKLEETQKTVKDGYLHTGDLGKVDAEGRLYLVDRKKDIIKIGGELISSKEIEEIINLHSCVKESAVIGIADELFGEKIKAFIVLEEGQKLEAEDIRGFCSKKLKYVKVPKVIEFIDALPKSTLNKIKKVELRNISMK